MIAALALLLQGSPCISDPLRLLAPLASVGKLDDRWPAGETIRFSAFPSFGRFAWVVEVNRPGKRAAAPSAEVVLLRREEACLHNTVVSRWKAPLLAGEADGFFADIAMLMERVRTATDQEVVTDGTAFELVATGPESLSHITLSPSAHDLSGAPSERIRVLAAKIAGPDVPAEADWRISRPD